MTLRLRTDGVTWQEVDDSIVVLDLNGSEYFRVRGSAALLWAALAEGREQEQLVDALASAYEVPRDQAREDVVDFLAQLGAANLLAPRPA